MVECIEYEGLLLAVILRDSFRQDGICFLTPDDCPLQLGYMQRPQQYDVPPHDHVSVPRQVDITHEVFIIKKGRVRLDIYAPGRVYLHSHILHPGDIALVANGGHGMHMLDECEIVEVKQGPYVGEKDKSRFTGISAEDVILYPQKL